MYDDAVRVRGLVVDGAAGYGSGLTSATVTGPDGIRWSVHVMACADGFGWRAKVRPVRVGASCRAAGEWGPVGFTPGDAFDLGCELVGRKG